jgi:hypothetical protein
MIPMRRHRMRGQDFLQVAGLVFLMGFIYRNFGPGSHAAATSSVITVVVAGTFLLMWLTSLKARE